MKHDHLRRSPGLEFHTGTLNGVQPYGGVMTMLSRHVGYQSLLRYCEAEVNPEKSGVNSIVGCAFSSTLSCPCTGLPAELGRLVTADRPSTTFGRLMEFPCAESSSTGLLITTPNLVRFGLLPAASLSWLPAAAQKRESKGAAERQYEEEDGVLRRQFTIHSTSR
ncbi:uncharacterized protein EI97DRAFT_441527 [Westerdykella ornata]|uniref:Uncharacterized protein n=1 Tax=Westerdykella ornata TaxID=318751 RepID=A0A6A6JLL4_WESOR|nr:uncharacterized protein EI97DRAFT_441527 [Westerdykella ornata]KAF2277481.1 hypothetical protein EI97DRAFT_441527 [Westerdykella ornata]